MLKKLITFLIPSFISATIAIAGPYSGGLYVNPGIDKASLGITKDIVADFGGVCNGTADDTNALAAAATWINSNSQQRTVTIGAGLTCTTTATVTIGNGKQQNTTLTALLTGTGTTATVASCTGISANDYLVIVRDAGTTYSGRVSSCVGTTLTLLSAYSGTDASSGKPVYTGAASTYNGGGFVGFGSGTFGEIQGAPAVSTIKYTGSAAPTTTLTATANANDVTLTVASTTNMSLGAPIGVTLDNGRVWWTSIDYIVSATSVAIMNEIPSTATSGNSITIANNPVVKVQGPILAPVVEGIKLDANNLAPIGLDVQHSIGGKFRGARGVLAYKYTGIGHFYHSTRAYLGTAAGTVDNDFEPYSLSPQNTKTIGLWMLGGAGAAGTSFNVAFSRNRFHGGSITMGGNDVTAAAIREEFADNNTWEIAAPAVNGASTSGAALYRQPSHYRTGFPGGNHWIGFAPPASGVTNGTDDGGAVVGTDFYTKWDTEAASFPSANAWGTDDAGNAKFNGGWGDNTAWSNWTPTLTCGTGAFTSAVGTRSRYKQIGKTVHYDIVVDITTNGTCATATLITLPTNFNATVGSYAAIGRNNTSGAVLIGMTTGTNQIRVTTTAGAYSGADGQVLIITGTYESS